MIGFILGVITVLIVLDIIIRINHPRPVEVEPETHFTVGNSTSEENHHD
jgi:hypothetical protein